MDNKKISSDCINISIPKEAENVQLPNPELLQFYKNYENRILWIDDEINEYTLEFAKNIIQWNIEDEANCIKPEDRKKIKIVFFSPGGDLDVNNCLVDTITLSKTPIIGINAGIAASSGCFIYLACHERYTFPTAEFLIHKGSGRFSGNYEDVVSAIINYQRQIKELGDFVLSRTNIPEDLFEENFSTEWYISAKEAIEYGVAHKIVTNFNEIF